MGFNIYDTTPLSYGDYVLPQWAQTLGWLMAVSSVAMVPIFAVIQIVRSYRWENYRGLGFCQVNGPEFVINPPDACIMIISKDS